jgi:cholest-4-en-3-one 26-monooxygenase
MRTDDSAAPRIWFNPLAGGSLSEVRDGLAAHRDSGCPVSPIGVPGMEYVSRHDHVRQVLLDDNAFSNEGNFLIEADASDHVPAFITQADPPEHTALRDLLRPAFRRSSMKDAAPWIAECVTR